MSVMIENLRQDRRPLFIEGETTTPGFNIVQSCVEHLQPGQSCQVTLTFTPQFVASQTGTLTIFNDSSDKQQSVALSGTGGLRCIHDQLPQNRRARSSISPSSSLAVESETCMALSVHRSGFPIRGLLKLARIGGGANHDRPYRYGGFRPGEKQELFREGFGPARL